MKESNQEIELDYKAIDLYNIVLDIEKYPDYIPWCSYIEILTKDKNKMVANMIVNYKFFPTQKFISNVFFDLEKKIIKTKYIEGPLKDLDTEWKFVDLKKNKSKIIFELEFEFKNYLHQKLAELFFPLVEKKMIDSFIKRADQILN
jgi:coenzyme Q-binding protein COQ10